MSGKIYQGCKTFPETAVTDCGGSSAATTARTADGIDVRMYGSRETLPSVEDVGNARMIDGRATVSIDKAFAQTMSPSAPYTVFVTPTGPSRGLYVTAQTAHSFQVLENPGGHSSLSFAYRIVASPQDVRGTRLAVVPRKQLGHAAGDARLAKELRDFHTNRDKARLDRARMPKPRFVPAHIGLSPTH